MFSKSPLQLALISLLLTSELVAAVPAPAPSTGLDISVQRSNSGNANIFTKPKLLRRMPLTDLDKANHYHGKAQTALAAGDHGTHNYNMSLYHHHMHAHTGEAHHEQMSQHYAGLSMAGNMRATEAWKSKNGRRSLERRTPLTDLEKANHYHAQAQTHLAAGDQGKHNYNMSLYHHHMHAHTGEAHHEQMSQHYAGLSMAGNMRATETWKNKNGGK